MRNLQSAVEREYRDIFTAVGNLDELVLKVADVRLEAFAVSHFDCEEVGVILSLLAGGVLGEKHLSYILKIVE